MEDCRKCLAHNMKQYRQILGISQTTLAERVGCSTTLIGNIEIGKRFPSAENINRIANALEVKIADLFSDEPESMKVMISKKELKKKFEKILDKAIEDFFRESTI